MKFNTPQEASPLEDCSRNAPSIPVDTVSVFQQIFSRERLSTDEAAEWLRVQAQTLRKSYSQRGSYCGVVPFKNPINRKLYWPAHGIRLLIEGEAA